MAVVTGAGRGLGRAMAHALAEAGAKVCLAARSVPELEETAVGVIERESEALIIRTDVTDPAAVDRLIAGTLAAWGRLDILVNNAGGGAGRGAPIVETGDDEWRSGLAGNLHGAFYCARAAARPMIAQKSGKIINMSSIFGERGGRNNYFYAVAKGGLIQLTRSLALSLAADNIQVNALCPGFMATAMILGREEDRGGDRYAGRFRHIPIGRIGEPEELGPLTVFLASPASDDVTGEAFFLDGGMAAGGFAPTGYAPEIPLGPEDWE
ncbi:MAG TPA: SDR family oxidoreductase [Dehalococcoidia bacterium]|nr:SDR family oxidoreductase [Dehalococcoidia bacterium]